MHVTKIKIKQDRVFIEYDKTVVVNEEELLNKYSIDSPEQPVGAFKDAFQKMDFFLIEMCELCDKSKDIPIMCEDVNITGLSFKYKDGELTSAVITGTKQLAYSNSPLVLNTPNKSVNIDGEFNKMVHLTDPCIAVLKAVVDHAKEYVNGERLQIEIDLKGNAKKADPEQYPSHGQGEGPKTDDPNAGKGDETPSRAEIGDTTPKMTKYPEPEAVKGEGMPDFEDDGINKTEDVRDNSEDEIPKPPE